MSDVALVMGSISDWGTMEQTASVLSELGVSYTKQIISAHRMPDEMFAFSKEAQANGYRAIIAGAGGAAHLPGMIAANTVLPVIGVPIQSQALSGMDSLLSIVQMPGGVPVATVAIGKAGAINAGILATQICGLQVPAYQVALQQYQARMHAKAVASNADFD
ncbi:5-(carboxyamino)imidazole ribonucleotide mutase [Latilactobacillus curvatus]|uniref:N5-carboxyaminoimidazole ribonucleotide mutase n=1 Tax=Latilactobacillus curvatus TaxID=28038 RepID=A0AAC9USY0_LATCU|nr:5-(carboxyamino)imidazole ribonucleotide mutase [Latilactobacillus curvatus]ASN60440.1 5-(carboxyamino)imidazole ribonucleotide mutase [Latilactobacillus curvatus]MCT3529012.1 5-(carboxyamino)imidazole ribonucleotide mutase [Latilactobacillus curvatus]